MDVQVTHLISEIASDEISRRMLAEEINEPTMTIGLWSWDGEK